MKDQRRKEQGVRWFVDAELAKVLLTSAEEEVVRKSTQDFSSVGARQLNTPGNQGTTARCIITAITHKRPS